MAQSLLVLSDAEIPHAAGICVAHDRDRAAELLGSQSVRAICIDRFDLEQALSDVRWLRRRRNPLPVLALVDSRKIARAVELLGAGVAEIVVRDSDAIRAVLERLKQLERCVPVGDSSRSRLGLVVRSAAMRHCLDLVEKAQRSQASVLLLGETGTGKEVLAKRVHEGGDRSRGPFVAINCAAFPETLLESELFGYERGAFTGANRAKRGHFEQANRGTLFLDEIGETSLGFQVKLLRVLQEGLVRPLGAVRESPVDARIIAATNRDLSDEVEANRFRRDLYYRLNVFPIQLPPLRGRTEDIVPLGEAFLLRRRGAGAPGRIAPDAARLLETYAWPGNVRELENEIERVVVNSAGEAELTARMLSPQIQGLASALPPDAGAETLRETMARLETWVLRRALERHGGKRIATARSLGVTRECLYKKMRRYGMQ